MDEIEARHRRLIADLPDAEKDWLLANYPRATLVDLCEGRFSRKEGPVDPGFKVTDEAEVDGETGRLFFGESRCLRPSEVTELLKNFLQGFRKSRAVQVDLRHQDSFCFSFDAIYNNWQCFAYEQKSRKLVRWGYQAD